MTLYFLCEFGSHTSGARKRRVSKIILKKHATVHGLPFAHSCSMFRVRLELIVYVGVYKNATV